MNGLFGAIEDVHAIKGDLALNVLCCVVINR